jgi:hypothetical protein
MAHPEVSEARAQLPGAARRRRVDFAGTPGVPRLVPRGQEKPIQGSALLSKQGLAGEINQIGGHVGNGEVGE